MKTIKATVLSLLLAGLCFAGPGGEGWNLIPAPGDSGAIVANDAAAGRIAGHFIDRGVKVPYIVIDGDLYDVMPPGAVAGDVRRLSDNGLTGAGWAQDRSGVRWAVVWYGLEPSILLEDAEAQASNAAGSVVAGVEWSSGYDTVWVYEPAGTGLRQLGTDRKGWSYEVVAVLDAAIVTNCTDDQGITRVARIPY